MTRQNSDICVQHVDLATQVLDPHLKALFAALEEQHPQLGMDWLVNLTRHALEDDDQAIVLYARDAAGRCALLPLKINRRREARALGNFYTSIYHPPCDTEEPLILYQAMFTHLAQQTRVIQLSLDPMDPDDPLFFVLESALKKAGWRGAHSYFCFANWTHDCCDQSWQDYFEQRPSRLRNTITRRTRKFLKGGLGELQIITDGPALERAIGDYTTIYNNSWKRQEPYPEFTPALLRLASDRGWLRLGLASYEGTPVAAQIWLINHGTAYIFKLAYREDFAHLSAGTVLTAHLMEHVLEIDKVSRIDYMSGDDAYKRDWMSRKRQRRGLAAYNASTAKGLLRCARHTVKTATKKLLPAARAGH